MNVPRLNVLQIYYEPAPAGQTRHVSTLIQALAQEHHVTVVLPDCLLPNQLPPTNESGRTRAEQNDTRWVALPMRKLLWPRSTLTALARLIRQGNWHIIHVHSLEAGLCGRLTSWVANTASNNNTHIVYTPQTIDIRRTGWHGLYRQLERLLATVTSTIISVNEADRQRLIGWGIPPEQIVTIPNGIEIEASQDLVAPRAARKSLGLDPDRPVVMQVARLSAQKNPIAFVEGAALVIERHPAVQFVMIGEGPLRDAIASRIQTLGLQGQVRLMGWRDHARRLMPAANVITLTSSWEGSPYSLLEAMAASRPVVATAVNGCPEIIVDGSSGFLTPPGDATAWAAKVVQVLEQPGLAEEMGRNARRRVEQRFSVQVTTARTVQLYQRLVAGSNPTRESR